MRIEITISALETREDHFTLTDLRFKDERRRLVMEKPFSTKGAKPRARSNRFFSRAISQF